MYSYREKEMIMAMKFMADHTEEFADKLDSLQTNISNNKLEEGRINYLPEVSSYADILKVAREAGYDTNYKIEDLLDEDEIKNLEKNYKNIEQDFAFKTKLNKTDLIFLISAVLFQMLRQIFQPSLNFDAFKESNERKGNQETAKDAEKQVNKEKLEKKKEKAEKDKTKDSRYYHASVEEIANIKYTCYDLTESGIYFDLKLGGSNHRYKTLGHDPWLGYFFGTLNILTNTVTMGKENNFKCYHVGRSEIKHLIPIANASMNKIIEHGITRWKESKATVALAVAHQTYHINSDKLSHDGIPLPFVEVLFDSKFIQNLTKTQFDYAKLEFLGNIAKQTFFAEAINYIISVAHRFTIIIQERKEEGIKLNINDFKESLIKHKTLDEVRTKKIILYSLCMASIANGLIIGGIAAIKTKNEELSKEALKKIDIGGYISTIIHLFSDIRFITKIKKEFCAQMVENDFQNRLKELNLN